MFSSGPWSQLVYRLGDYQACVSRRVCQASPCSRQFPERSAICPSAIKRSSRPPAGRGNFGHQSSAVGRGMIEYHNGGNAVGRGGMSGTPSGGVVGRGGMSGTPSGGAVGRGGMSGTPSGGAVGRGGMSGTPSGGAVGRGGMIGNPSGGISSAPSLFYPNNSAGTGTPMGGDRPHFSPGQVGATAGGRGFAGRWPGRGGRGRGGAHMRSLQAYGSDYTTEEGALTHTEGGRGADTAATEHTLIAIVVVDLARARRAEPHKVVTCGT
jgi:hypothetical protein